MKKTYTQGFTLIELLVVIAIIGILSSVVLVSLNSARGKGSDAAIKANLNTIRTQAEVYLDNSTAKTYGTATPAAAGCNYANTLFADQTISSAVQAATTASGGTATADRRCAVGVNGATWAVSVPLKQDATRSQCMDNTGISREVTGASPTLGGGTVPAACPAS